MLACMLPCWLQCCVLSVWCMAGWQQYSNVHAMVRSSVVCMWGGAGGAGMCVHCSVRPDAQTAGHMLAALMASVLPMFCDLHMVVCCQYKVIQCTSIQLAIWLVLHGLSALGKLSTTALAL